MSITSRQRLLATAIACLLMAACGTQSTSPSIHPSLTTGAAPTTSGASTLSPSPTFPPVSTRPQPPAGTACGTSVAPAPLAPTPAPAAPTSQPTWSRGGVAGSVTSLAWSPDGTLLANTPADAQGTDDTARLWTAAGAPVARLTGHTAPIQCVAWSMDSQLLASASGDRTVRLWARTGRLVRVLSVGDPVFSLAWSPDGTLLAVGAIHFPAATATGIAQLPGVVQLWHADGTLLHTMGTRGTGGKFLNLAWSPDGTLLAAGAVDYATWRADATHISTARAAGGTPAWAMAWAPDGATLALGDENGLLQLVSPTGDIIASAAFAGDINAVSYAPDGHSLAVGTNGAVHLVRPDDPTHAEWVALTAGDGDVAWSPDGGRLAIAITNGLAVLTVDGSAVAALTGCLGTPVAVAWTGMRLVAATDQGHLCVWSAP